ncbi:hypothetical protein CPHO_04065 [Corynebacterium phocae]|uniref:Uncharacterized protein n=1 Tax=Corynebacterium phocae TaxID=161895 RepID=A0A1L7D286_9CORY|nr:nicotinate-nucleotide--dimethylbenzimidazole phosphoribosyltransferase [Corynebacterium phocae]APT92200.1 hypothetical protein CPHO_04065 [Corynebacterium phocae]KAA8725779.1 nicotinate-nucleotide--dimethylbenzimidazole phosphoribosyltransferase [Corynebacterium phocae]
MTDFLEVTAPARSAADATLLALSTSPRGVSFGRLGAVAAWLAGCQDCVPPARISSPRVVVFAGQHGIAARGVSAFAPEATTQQLQELEDGLSPAHALARIAHPGGAHGSAPAIVTVATPPSGAIDVADALSEQQLEDAFTLGREVADKEIDAGADFLIPANLGVGSTTVAATVMGLITGTEPVAIIGPGSGITDQLWKAKVRVIRDAMFRARDLRHLTYPRDIIRTIGGYDLAALTAFIAQAAARRTPMLIDSPLTAVAAVLAERLAPGTAAWVQAASVTAEPAHHLALEDLGLQPLLDLKLTTGMGVGSLSALPLIHGALEIVAEEVSATRELLNQPEDQQEK